MEHAHCHPSHEGGIMLRDLCLRQNWPGSCLPMGWPAVQIAGPLLAPAAVAKNLGGSSSRQAGRRCCRAQPCCWPPVHISHARGASRLLTPSSRLLFAACLLRLLRRLARLFVLWCPVGLLALNLRGARKEGGAKRSQSTCRDRACAAEGVRVQQMQHSVHKARGLSHRKALVTP